MRDLFGSHGLQYRTAAGVSRRKSAEVPVEMSFDLALRFGYESEACAVTKQRSRRTDRERAQIPERIEQTGAR